MCDTFIIFHKLNNHKHVYKTNKTEYKPFTPNIASRGEGTIYTVN